MEDTSKVELRFWEVLAGAAYFIGLFVIGVYAYAEYSWRAFGVLWMVGSAAWLAGTALGFLFGVPRVRSGEPITTGQTGTETSIVPNTNLEQISDWLTKIIVGATLVQLGPLSDGIGRLSVKVGDALGTGDGVVGGAVIGGATLIFYFTAGFIWGYLWCSLRVFREMQSLIVRERQVRVVEEKIAIHGR